MTKVGDAGRMMITNGMAMLFNPNVTTEWNALYSMQGDQPKAVREKFLDELEESYSKF